MRQTEDIILIGGGGHCTSVIDVIEAEDRFQIIGILDRKEMLGREVSGYPIIGTDDDIQKILITCKNFHITVGHIQSNAVRVQLYKKIHSLGGLFPTIVSPTAYISKKNKGIGSGSVIMHHAVVNAGARIGENCIINTCALLEHDVVVKDHCHISTGARLNGACVIQSNSFVGSNSTLVQGITIEENNVIAAGSVVLSNTQKNALYAGNPAQYKKQR